MLLTLLSQWGPQITAKQTTSKGLTTTGPSASDSTGIMVFSILGTTLGVIVGVAAAILSYRRNHSIFWAIIAFFFSEIYIGWYSITTVTSGGGRR